MKVRYRQSGGFAGLTRGCDLDTAAMDPREGEVLGELLSAAEEKSRSVSGGTRDGLIHEITIEEGGARRKICYADPDVPPSALPLLAFLAGRSGPLEA